jgi:hypothetical protein
LAAIQNDTKATDILAIANGSSHRTLARLFRARMGVAGRIGEGQERNIFTAHAKVDDARFIADSSRSAHGDDVTIIDLPALNAGEPTNCRCTLFIIHSSGGTQLWTLSLSIKSMNAPL